MKRLVHGEPEAAPCAGSLFSRLYLKYIQPLVTKRFPPWYDARGVAIGLWVGLALPVGCHVAVLTALRAAVRFNYLSSLLFSCVGNPVTMLPLYFGYYRLGSYLTGRPQSLSFDAFQSLMHPVSESTFFWEALAAFGSLGWEILMRWGAASFAVGTVAAVLGYCVAWCAQTAARKREARVRGIDYAELSAELEAAASRGLFGALSPHKETCVADSGPNATESAIEPSSSGRGHGVR
jgi:uncharacterized protein (DUF2062 family)